NRSGLLPTPHPLPTRRASDLARGAMEIIVATIGLQVGILTQDMFSIIVLMAMATSLMAPPALRWTLSKVVPEEQELERLRQEEIDRKSTRLNSSHVKISYAVV